MQMLSRSVACPTCGAAATVTLIEDRDPLRDTEGHRIEFRCSQCRYGLDDAGMLRLWADTRASVNDVA